MRFIRGRVDSCIYPTRPFTIREPQNPWFDEFYLVQEVRVTDFKAPKFWQGASGWKGERGNWCHLFFPFPPFISGPTWTCSRPWLATPSPSRPRSDISTPAARTLGPRRSPRTQSCWCSPRPTGGRPSSRRTCWRSSWTRTWVTPMTPFCCPSPPATSASTTSTRSPSGTRC